MIFFLRDIGFLDFIGTALPMIIKLTKYQAVPCQEMEKLCQEMEKETEQKDELRLQ